MDKRLIDADKLLTDLKDKKKSLRESLNFAKREGETKWADELREQMQILTQIIDGVEHGGYAPNPIPLPTIKPGDIDEHPLDLLYKTKGMSGYQFKGWMKERTAEEIDSLTDIYRALKRGIATEKVNREVSHD